jgi:hypothetical protein
MSPTDSPATRISRRLANRIAPDSSESGVALLSAILFMIIMAGIGTVIVGTVLGQVSPTYLDQKSTQTVYAAQSGMQAALSRFRAAVATDGAGHVVTDTNGNAIGDPTKLPCSLSGTLDPTTPANGIGYSVAIYYYSTDPTYLATTAVPVPPGNLPCSAGGGVTSTTTNPVKFALVLSSGTGNTLPGAASTSTAGNRSLGAVYQFKVSTVNIAGGLINDYNSGGAYCLSAVSAAPGSPIQFLPASQCTDANKALDLWIYYSDYEIKLASSFANGAQGLCITGPVAPGSANPQTAVLQTCVSAPDGNRWNQLWSWVGSNSWQGQSLVNVPAGPTSWYLGTGQNAGANLIGKYLLVQNSGNNGGFSPSTSVGAGAASYNTHQLVNYLEFGRCADVTSGTIGNTFMISYPCKQDPTSGGANLNWNHKWYYTEPPAQLAGPLDVQGPQQIVVNTDNLAPSTDPGANYCLYVGTPTTVVGSMVTFTPCATTTTHVIWTRVFNTGTYASSYTMTTLATNGTTLCLQADSTKLYLGWSELDLAVCNGSLAQKWNAPATYVASEVGGYKEIGG